MPQHKVVAKRNIDMIELKDIYKIYSDGDSEIRALDGVSLFVEKGEFVAIVGSSGSGKSTCMNIIGCLDIPTSGKYFLWKTSAFPQYEFFPHQ